MSIILFTIIFINFKSAIIITLNILIIYFLIIKIFKSKLRINSKVVAENTKLAIKTLQEGLGGIREITLDSTQQIYCEIFKKADKKFRESQASNAFIGQSPRIIVETVAILAIVSLSFILSLGDSGLIDSLPILGALALAAQKLLPAVQQAYSSWSVIEGNRNSLEIVVGILENGSQRQHLDAQKINFVRELTLSNVFFEYRNANMKILNGINLTINRGDRVGLIGTTGAGKTTLVDIIMGLLIPTNGSLLVDQIAITGGNRAAWQKKIAHVPQQIYLADGTIEENIAFGVPSQLIDIELVAYASKIACIDEVINAWPEKYRTIVGERGARISGGQRQRIGIARAIYRRAELIVLDEATSALDNQTEAKVMSSINNLGESVTIILISHRISPLTICNKLYRMNDGKLSLSAV